MEQIKALITECEECGIKLWVEAGKLKFKMPGTVSKDDYLPRLKMHKEALINYLNRCELTSGIKRDHAGRYEPFPMSDVQSAYLLGRQNSFDYSGVACHIYQEFVYDELDPIRVKTVFDDIIKEHDMLRTVMYEDGYQQVLQEELKLSIPYLEIERDGEEQLKKLRNEMSSRIYTLGNWPMFGVAVTKHNDQAILHFSMEFLVADWTSIWMLLSEFENRYFGCHIQTEPCTLTFRDCLLEERHRKDGPVYERDKSYWLKRLEEFPSAPTLKQQKSSDKQQNGFGRLFLKMAPEHWLQFKEKAYHSGITPTAAVLAVYGETLAKWSDNKQLSLNLTVLNRPDYDLEISRVIGDFTTISLLAADMNPKQSFREQAYRLNQTLFDDLDHRTYSGIEFIREIARQKGRDAAFMPYVFTSAIGLLDQQTLRGRFEGEGISQTPQVFIDCQAMDGQFGLQINWDIRLGVFPEGMVEDMFRYFEDRLMMLGTDQTAWESKPLGTLPEWQIAERRQANDTSSDISDYLLYSEFLKRVQEQPEALAVADQNGEYTYKELHRQALSIAAQIVNRGGQPGQTIPVLVGKSRFQIAAVLGILYMGGVYVPVDADTAPGRLRSILDSLGMELVVATADQQPINGRKLQYVEADRDYPEMLSAPITGREQEPAYIIYTSGTTGTPKGVVITHAAAMNTIIDINQRFDISSTDRVLGLSKLNFDLSVYDIFGLLSVGGAVIYPTVDNAMNPEHYSELIRKYGITVWNTVPALMKMLITYEKEQCEQAVGALRCVLLSGDWIPVNMPEQIHAYNGLIRIICMGGATEASIWSNYHEYRELNADWVSIPYGRPLSNQQLYILDETLNDVPVWATGEIYIAGKGLAQGYYGDQKLTDEKFIVHPQRSIRMYKTGDIGRYLPGGDIEFLGRKDQQVKIRGHRIELGEIEHALLSCPGVSEAAALVDLETEDMQIKAVVRPGVDPDYCECVAEQNFHSILDGVESQSNGISKMLQRSDYQKAFRARDYAAEASILYTLQQLHIISPDYAVTMDEITEAPQVLAKYRWLLRHWVLELCKTGLVISEEDCYRAVKVVNDQDYRNNWDLAYQLWSEDYGSLDLLNYVKDNTDQLDRILTGEIDPLGILYPEGSKKYTEALYVTNTMTICINTFICEFLKHRVARDNDRPLQILEIGSGTGATAKPVIAALEECQADYKYYFTDISKYFFPDAQKRFGENPKVTIKEFNADEDYRRQGFHSNSFDVIIGAYVLDNVKDIRMSLSQIEEMLVPNGYLLFSEPMKIEPWVLASQALLMTPPNDELRRDKTFLAADEWVELLNDERSKHSIATLPDASSPIYSLGAMLYIKQFKQERIILDQEILIHNLREYLPSYMEPGMIEIVDQIPLNANGKVDRKAISGLLKRFPDAPSLEKERDDFCSSLEKALADIWKQTLNIPHMGRSESFFDFGADSLVMAQTATRIRNELGVQIQFDVLLRQMLNEPSIEQLARFISQDQETTADTNEVELAYVIKYGGAPADRVRVMVHGSLGSLDSFDFLGPELVTQGGGEVIGIGLSDLEGYLKIPHDEVIDRLSDLYTDMLIKMNYEKIQLIGYSFGGVVVVEMAKRLMERGIYVEDVSIIDGGKVPIILGSDLVSEIICLDPIEIKPADLGFENANVLQAVFRKKDAVKNKVVMLSDMKKELGSHDLGILEWLEALDQEQRFEYYAQLYQQKTGHVMEKEAIRRMMLFFIHSMKALDYTSDPFFGDIRYFTCESKEGHYEQLTTFIDEWEEVCLGDMHIIRIPGTHLTSVEDQQFCVKLAAEIVKKKGD